VLLNCKFVTLSVCWTQNQRFASSHFCKKCSHIICTHVCGISVTTPHSQCFTSYLHQTEKFSRVRHVVVLFSTKLPPQLKLPVQLLHVTLWPASGASQLSLPHHYFARSAMLLARDCQLRRCVQIPSFVSNGRPVLKFRLDNKWR
jgi:hypothetical protein